MTHQSSIMSGALHLQGCAHALRASLQLSNPISSLYRSVAVLKVSLSLEEMLLTHSSVTTEGQQGSQSSWSGWADKNAVGVWLAG